MNILSRSKLYGSASTYHSETDVASNIVASSQPCGPMAFLNMLVESGADQVVLTLRDASLLY